MKQNPVGKFLGLTKNELTLFLSLGGVIVGVIMLFGAYVLYTSSPSLPAPVSTSFPPLQPSGTPPPYIPAPSLTGWPSGTQGPATPTLAPTKTPRPTRTPTATPTVTDTPTATDVPPTATQTATLTPSAQFGTSSNPVPIGTAFTIPDFGTLTVIRSSWTPGQTGVSIVELSFVCGLPIGQQCKTNQLILNAQGGSGNVYERTLGAEIPEPRFGYDLGSTLYGGGTETGNAGFLIQKGESSLVMLVQVFLKDGQFSFWIGPTS